jgi:hypothetical protein
MGYEKNEVETLERAETRDEGILKPVPIIQKTDYSGAYEVRSLLRVSTTAS